MVVPSLVDCLCVYVCVIPHFRVIFANGVSMFYSIVLAWHAHMVQLCSIHIDEREQAVLVVQLAVILISTLSHIPSYSTLCRS